MRGKVCLVTGATSGIGKMTALELATKGATVVIVGRSQERCLNTLAEIEAMTGSKNLDYLVGDLSSFVEVRRLSQEFLSRYNKLNVLVNNAGAIFMRKQNSPDGLEMTWALNHFAYFWLSCLLLDVLKASSPSRIVNVSSDAHKRATMIEPPNFRGKMPVGYITYADTKLANILFTNQLSYSIKSTGVTVNALHPGVVATSFGANNGLIGKIMQLYASTLGVKPAEGAKTVVYLATAPELYTTTGKYFVKCKEVNSSRLSYDTKFGTKLWQWSLDVSGRLGMDTRRIEILK
ncbi:MAG: SDR family oxidoreductase [Cyanobacteria bacterium REEB67]|nr:SDR family oxidoreductase [Cyanobacteria bacterium REEB67]